MFKYIKSFFSALNANAHPGDIAHAVAMGLLLAAIPKGNLLWVLSFSVLVITSYSIHYTKLYDRRVALSLRDIPRNRRCPLRDRSFDSLPFHRPQRVLHEIGLSLSRDKGLSVAYDDHYVVDPA